MDLFLIFNILFGIVGAIYLYLYWINQHWKKRNVPYIEPELFYGNVKDVGTKLHNGEFLRDTYLKFKSLGPITGIYIFTQPLLIINDLDLIKSIFVKDFSNFTNRGVYYNEKDDPLSAHLVSMEDDAWRQLRSKVSPIFSSGRLKMIFDSVGDIADRLIDTIRKETVEKGHVEVKEVSSRFTTDAVGATSFGIECNSLEDKNALFYQVGRKAFSGSNFLKRMVPEMYPNLARKLHITTTKKEMSDFYTSVVESTIKCRQENPKLKRNDFMDMLMKHLDSGTLTIYQVISQMLIFFLGGK